MKYISTRGQSPALSFEETMLTGLAPDGGLYVPDAVPVLPPDAVAKLRRDDYESLAFKVMRPFVGDTFTDDEFEEIIARAYADFGHVARAPLKQLDRGQWLMELFHGPTLAFKDFAMQLIGQMFQTVLERRGQRVTIVGATSGDTGS
ncbi:MAG: threonine synthase, partial [Silicimonas sp.]|nr:threonine synthase [Silicimonas sp.]